MELQKNSAKGIKMDYKALEQKIINSYVEGVTITQAEGLAGEFLEAQIKVSEELKQLDLNARLIKDSVKETRAKVFLAEATKTDKKPSDSMLQAYVDSNEKVLLDQTTLADAEASRDELYRMFSIFQNAHLHFRAIAKGKFD
jgi:hypothetical protein